jgi:hypothetical protein
MPDVSPEPSSPSAPRVARAVPATHAIAWYREAMRLWKRGPLTFTTLAVVTFAIDVALSLVPGVGVWIAQVVVPLAACGLLFASLAADRGGRPRLADLAAILGATPAAIAAVVASGMVVFAAEALVAQTTAQVNLLAPGTRDAALDPETVLAIYTVGIAVSLPFTFVPFAALFDRLPFGAAFAQSFEGFGRNLAPFALYGALSLLLLTFGWATFGLGLLLALPWWAASSYAAWKDVFGVDRDRITRPDAR